MADELKPIPDPSKSEQVKPAAKRKAQVEQGKAKLAATKRGENANPIVLDETYGELRKDNRVVMRNAIALNIDSFRSATAEFGAREKRVFPELTEVAAPFFSVVIPTYNGVRFLPTVLDALQAQTFRDFEVIIIDDASSDDTVAMVERDYAGVRVLVNRHNAGFVRSCNTAADAALGQFVVLLNNDTEPEPTWLAELAKAICANPQAAVITSKLLLYSHRTTLHTTGDQLGVDGLPRNRGVWEEDKGQYDGQVAVFSGCGAATAYRKAVWQALGGFDDDFWMYVEDVDFSFRARLAGWETVFVPGARVYHHLSASGGDTLSSYYVGRNTIWMIVKNMPLSLLVRNFDLIARAQLKISLDALKQIQGAAARARLRGQLAGLLGLPAQLAKRRTIQPRRQVEDHVLKEMLVG